MRERPAQKDRQHIENEMDKQNMSLSVEGRKEGKKKSFLGQGGGREGGVAFDFPKMKLSPDRAPIRGGPGREEGLGKERNRIPGQTVALPRG